MKKMNYDILEDLQVEEYSSTDERVRRIYGLVAEKADLKVARPGFRRRRYMLVAAVAAAGVLLAAAGYFTASDAFRGWLREPGAGGSAELSSTAPIVDKTGSVLDLAEPSVSGDIKVTPKAIAGDDSTFTILYELENTKGEPLGILQEDGTPSAGNVMFRRSMMTSPTLEKNGGARRFMSESIETRIDGSKGTILQRYNLFDGVPMGETIQVDLGNLWQLATLAGTEVGLGQGALYEAVSKFPAVTDADFIATDELGFTSAGGAGFETNYALKADSEIAIPLEGPFSGFTLTGAAVHNGSLYLRGLAPADTRPGDLLRGSALLGDALTGGKSSSAVKSGPIFAGVRDLSAPQPWVMEFKGVSSLESLKDHRLLARYGEGVYPLCEDGEWSFDIQLA